VDTEKKQELARQWEITAADLGQQLDEARKTEAADKAARLVALEEVQAAERAAIIERYGEQAAQALRQAGASVSEALGWVPLHPPAADPAAVERAVVSL
jgi:hypothetical protein